MLSKPQIKHIRSLSQLKFRKEHRQFIAEGPKIVGELPNSPIKVESVYGLNEWVEENRNRFEYVKTEVIRVNTKELERISQLKTPNQVVAVCRMPEMDLDDIYEEDGSILCLDGIRDPGNMGTIIRTADWFGIKNIVCSDDCVDVFNPKVVQSTMGSIARVNVYYTDLPTYLSAGDQEIYAMVMNGESIWDTKLDKGIIVIGNESNGIRPEVIHKATKKISIPSNGEAESLNASVAAGVVMAVKARSQILDSGN